MNILLWVLKFFKEPAAPTRRVKFVEGTEWTCVKCGTVLGVAKCDIHSGDPAASSAWEIKGPGFWNRAHCAVRATRIGPDSGRVEFHTPTGWVG